MSETRSSRGADQTSAEKPADPTRYPTNHVVAIVDTPEQVTNATVALVAAGLPESGIAVGCGAALADAIHASTGRKGLTNLAIRIAERLGLEDDEMEVKHRYEQALRDGRLIVSVPAETDYDKQRAAVALRENGASFINFLGRFTIEAMR